MADRKDLKAQHGEAVENTSESRPGVRNGAGPIDLQEFRDTGHRLIDLMADYLERVDDKPVFPDVDPAVLKRLFEEPLPRTSMPLGEIVAELEEKLLPYCTHVNHPGYFGLITPTPTPAGILGDLIASALNQNVGAYVIGPSATALERQTIRWLTDLVGYDPKSGGNLTSGGTLANFIGLKLARDWASGDLAQHEGVTRRWAAYTSEERHVSVDKAVDAVGIGRSGMRILPTDDQFRIRIDALEAALAEDRRKGIRPMCIVAMGGSTNTGAVDPLSELRRIADRENAWLHVDAAYGGGMLLSRKYPGRLADLALADSIVLDPHKWFYAPLDAGAILVKDETHLTRSFGLQPPYLTDPTDRGEQYNYYVHGFEQSRRFRGLKVWMGLKRYGTGELGRWIDGNVDQALRLYERCQSNPDFEAAVKPGMSAICLRYRGGEIDEDRRARLHAEVARRVVATGSFWISTTILKGRWWFRVNPVNFRTRAEHIDALFELLQTECERSRLEDQKP
jgi:aromatic-L-amino-acid/L-tryptophan decarboxylase